MINVLNLQKTIHKLSKIINSAVFGLLEKITKHPVNVTKKDGWNIFGALAPPNGPFKQRVGNRLFCEKTSIGFKCHEKVTLKVDRTDTLSYLSCVSDKLFIAYIPRTMWPLFSLFLIFCCFSGLEARNLTWKNMKIIVNVGCFVLTTVR